MNYISSLTLILPLLGFLFSFFFGKNIGNIGASVVTTAFMYASVLISMYLFINVMLYKTTYIYELCDWVTTDIIHIKWNFQYDALTVVMLLVVNIVSCCTHLYSIEYMEGDPHKVRFMSYLSLFTFFMIILITSGNLFQLFVGWEGVGICSYLLISFWYNRLESNKAAIMAVMINKVGDIALLIAFCILLYVFKTLDYGVLFSICTDTIFNNTEYQIHCIDYNSHYLINEILTTTLLNYNVKKYIYTICIMFIIGAICKSAQLGMHAWLPEAMEGPTPVSSLIHAATMVTAGIFLIIRCSFIFEIVQEVLLLITLIGSLTSFFASTIACFQDDIKKIVAYSTCSQLGYMFTACGYSAYTNSIFHLFNHAFFKALLFLTAGYVIHAMSNTQDMRLLSSSIVFIPFAYTMLCIGSLALIGMPFLSGFYSKEKILELIYSRIAYSMDSATLNIHIMQICAFISTIAVIFTITYSSKMISILAGGMPEGPIFNYYSIKAHISEEHDKSNTVILNVHYGDYLLIIALFLLSLLSIFSGYLFSDIMIGQSTTFWNDSIYSSLTQSNIYNINENEMSHLLLANAEYNKYIKGVSTIFALYYSFIFIMIYSIWYAYGETNELTNYITYCEDRIYTNTLSEWEINVRRTLIDKYIYINKIWMEPVINLFFKIGLTCYYSIDKGILELLGPMSVVKFINNNVYKYKKYQTTNKTTIFINIVVLLALMLIILINFFI